MTHSIIITSIIPLEERRSRNGGTTFVVNPDNKDIILPTSVYFDYLEVGLTIHHTNTVSVAIFFQTDSRTVLIGAFETRISRLAGESSTEIGRYYTEIGNNSLLFFATVSIFL